LQPGTPCYKIAASGIQIFKTGLLQNTPVDFPGLVAYLGNVPEFYNGTTSTLLYGWAENPHYNIPWWPTTGIHITDEVMGQFRPYDVVDGTTAVTVRGYTPLISFWQPNYCCRDNTGFGEGIDPSNSGVNIYNESIILHESLHGFTGDNDSNLTAVLQPGSAGSGTEKWLLARPDPGR